MELLDKDKLLVDPNELVPVVIDCRLGRYTYQDSIILNTFNNHTLHII